MSEEPRNLCSCPNCATNDCTAGKDDTANLRRIAELESELADANGRITELGAIVNPEPTSIEELTDAKFAALSAFRQFDDALYRAMRRKINREEEPT